jgi:O-antigen/teichoic acid export membrane protein
MATVPMRARGYLDVVRSDSLARNSLYMMASTVLTAGLGYVFWIVTVHVFTSAQVGTGSAVISLCSTVALLTYLGSWATLIERLHTYEQSRKWTAVIVRICVITAALTAVVVAAAVPVLAHSKSYGSFFSAAPMVAMAVAGSAAWTLVNLFSAAFIAARRADGLLSIQTLVSGVKVLLVVPIAIAGRGAGEIVGAWAGSALLGVAIGAVWLLPRLGLGRRPLGTITHRSVRTDKTDATDRTDRTDVPASERRPARHRQRLRPSASSAGRLIGQHLTSVGGAATPLMLPILVVLRLGVTPNAYFYITWMIGGVFFMVSPSVSAALFAETVRAGSDLRTVVMRAFRIISCLLIPAMVVMIAGGRIVLGIFGQPYASAGYGLLVLLAISSLPDAVSNVAVAVFRVTNRLSYSASLNIGIMIITIAGAWFLMPPLGILGAGAAWLAAQVLGAIASIPAYTRLGPALTHLDTGRTA